MGLKYAYFTGCVSKQITAEYNTSARLACEKLGIELVDIPEFSCCGSGVLKETDKKLNTVLNGRNFALSEAKGLDMMTICSTCVNNLNKDLWTLKHDSEKLEEANEELQKIEMQCEAKLEVKHFLWVLEQEYGFDKISKLVNKSLQGLKVAPFYGCHILRPSKMLSKYQNARNPHNFEDLITALGAVPVSLKERTDCCGFHVTLINNKAATKMSNTFVDRAKETQADLIVTNCPFCHMQMDMYQKQGIPVLHFTQLLCLALGIKPEELGLKRHFVKIPDSISKRFQ